MENSSNALILTLPTLVLLACGGSGGAGIEPKNPSNDPIEKKRQEAERKIRQESEKYDTTASAKKIEIPKFDVSEWNVLYKNETPHTEFHLAENMNEFFTSETIQKLLASKSKETAALMLKEKDIFYHKGETTPDLWGVMPYTDFIKYTDENIAPYFTSEEIAGVNLGIDQLAQKLIDQKSQALNSALKPMNRLTRTPTEKTTWASWDYTSTNTHELTALLRKGASSIGFKTKTDKSYSPLQVQGIFSQRFGPMFAEVQFAAVDDQNELFTKSIINQISVGIDLPSEITPYIQIAHNKFAYNLTSITSNIGVGAEIVARDNIFYSASILGNTHVGYTRYKSHIQSNCTSASLQLITKIKTTNGTAVYFEGDIANKEATNFSIKMEYEV